MERLLKTNLHSLSELVVKQKTLFEFFFLTFLIMIIMDLFKQFVTVMCNLVMAGIGDVIIKFESFKCRLWC